MMAPTRVHTSTDPSWVKAALRATAEQLGFSGWFDREEQWVRNACIHTDLDCTRSARDKITIGDAIIDLSQLQRALDHRPQHMAEATVRAWVERAIAAQSEPKHPCPISHVLPHLRPPADAATLPWHTPIANGRLVECLVADEQTSITYLGPLQIVGHKVGVDGLRTRARLNLSVLMPYDLSGCTPHASHPDVWVCATGDGHDAARLLLADQLAGGPVIAWAPHRDRLVFTRCPPQELGSIAWTLRQEALQSAHTATHPITAEAFSVEDGQVSHLHFVGQGERGRLKAATP
jgi:hypothetical protein